MDDEVMSKITVEIKRVCNPCRRRIVTMDIVGRIRLVSVAVALMTVTAMPLAYADWHENFDDGDISDWEIRNPYKEGYEPITIEPSTEQCVSPEYSLKVSGPAQSGYIGAGTGPDPQINSDLPYSVEFQFRWDDFHWYYLVEYQQIVLYIDYPSLPLGYFDDEGQHKLWDTPDFKEYCPRNTWTHFRIDVTPCDSSYTIIVDGDTLAIINYGSYNTGIEGFQFCECGEHNVNYLKNGYYDDISICGTSVSCEFSHFQHWVPRKGTLDFTLTGTNGLDLPIVGEGQIEVWDESRLLHTIPYWDVEIPAHGSVVRNFALGPMPLTMPLGTYTVINRFIADGDSCMCEEEFEVAPIGWIIEGGSGESCPPYTLFEGF
jgi:hypothetical protein